MINLFPVDNIAHSVDDIIIDVLHGDLRQGSKVDEFEQALAKWIGFSNILTTCSGTAALQLALRLAEVGCINGDRKSVV